MISVQSKLKGLREARIISRDIVGDLISQSVQASVDKQNESREIASLVIG